MVQTRNRAGSFPSLSAFRQDVGGFFRWKSANSLNRSNSSASSVGSASTSFGGGGGEVVMRSEFPNSADKRGDSSPSSSSFAENSCLLEDSSPERQVGSANDFGAASKRKSETKPDATELNGEQDNGEDFQGDADEVFFELPREESNNCDNTQLSVIDEEKDDAEARPLLETLDEECDDLTKTNVSISSKEEFRDGESEVSNGNNADVVVRPRHVPSLSHNSRGQSMSSLDIPHSYSQPERLSVAGDTNLTNSTSVAQGSKLPLRRGLSSSFLTNRDSDSTRRPLSQHFDSFDKGTILAALSSATSLPFKNLDRNLSASTPSIDSAVSELVKGHGHDRDTTASCKTVKHSRTPSIVVPAITPRIPLMGLLPHKVSRPSSERTVNGIKTRERSSGFFGSRARRAKQSESRPHFWIKNSCSNSDCCYVCNKPLANTDAYQCNDCLSSVHASCKTSLDKASCNKMKHPKPRKMQQTVGPLRPPNLYNIVGNGGPRAKDSDQEILEPARSASMKSHRHSVAGIFPDMSYSLTAPAALSTTQSTYRTYANGFRSYVDMEETWTALGLWDELPDAWSTGPGKSEKKKLSTKEAKRQDNFHEMLVTEQHHCQTLTVLKCTYFAGLLTNGIVPADKLSQLLPCLDDLIDIHYSFFRSLKQKRDSALVVGSVHDVLTEQFSNETARRMVRAYTRFCFQKDATVREYNRLVNCSVELSSFVKSVTPGSFYKSRSLPDCLLLVTQRLSKYHSFVENLRKNTADDSPEKEGILIAERAVKELIASVDSGIDMAQMQQARLDICNAMDPRAATELAVQDVADGKTVEWKELFKVDDLRSPERTLLYYGDVFWQNARQKPAEITMLLFTDVIVFLQKSHNGSYSFFKQDQKNGVIRLHKLIPRDKAGRLGSQGIYLIAVSPKPDMYDISCKSKKELNVWMARIQGAVQSCNASNRQSLLTGSEEADLQQFFDKLAETKLFTRGIFEERMKVYAGMFDYIARLPLRSNEDKEKIASLISNYKNSVNEDGDLENAATIWRTMQERFGVNPVDAASSASEAQEDSLPEEKEKDEVSSGSGAAELGRSKTFHFVADNVKKPKLRKHPTVAGIPEIQERSGKRVAVPQLVNDLRQTDSKTVAGTSLYLLNRWAEFEMQIEELKQEKLRLTAELALARERSRQTAGALACDSGLENLRRLSTELEGRRRQFYQEMSDKEIDLNCREKALKEREEKVVKEDAEIRNRWACLTSAWENQRAHGLPLPPLVASSSPSFAPSHASDSPPPAASNCTVSPVAAELPDSSTVSVTSMQRTSSFRPVDAAVPAHLAGAMTHAGRGAEVGIKQQFPTNLSSKDVLDSLSKKLRASSKDKSGSKRYFISAKSPDRQTIPSKLAINKK